jgi:hypothetical protein
LLFLVASWEKPISSRRIATARRREEEKKKRAKEKMEEKEGKRKDGVGGGTDCDSPSRVNPHKKT